MTGLLRLETRDWAGATGDAVGSLLLGLAFDTDFKVRLSGFRDGTACPPRLGLKPDRLTTLRLRGLPKKVLLSRPGSPAALDLR